jgi:hypothetical protein
VKQHSITILGHFLTSYHTAEQGHLKEHSQSQRLQLTMTTAKAPGKGSRRSEKSKGHVYGKKGAVTVLRIAAERTALLAERQTQLESILNRVRTDGLGG